MDNFRNKTLKIIMGGLGIFVLGIVAGYQLSTGRILSIQGYLFNAVNNVVGLNATSSNASSSNASSSNASSSNASSSNASSSNASSSNASSSNASSSNASDANAKRFDNIMELEGLSFENTNVFPGDKVRVNLSTVGACNSSASIIFKNDSNGLTFTATVNSINDNPYIEIPSSIVPATYNVTDVLLVGTNSDNTTFTKQYSINSSINSFYYHFTNTLTINAKKVDENVDTPKLTLNSISLDNTSVKVNEKVYVNIDTNYELINLKLIFADMNNKTITAYVKSLNNKPYFEVPSTVEYGKYSLVSAILTSSNASAIYSSNKTDGNYFDFNSSFEVIEEQNLTSYVLNNEDINSDIITKLYTSDTKEIIINADSNSIINSEIFNLIKGKDKKLVLNYNDNQMVFNGKDVTSSKTIDVSINVDSINNNSRINELVVNGIVVNFTSNGNLPGKALVRIKATNEMDSILGDKKVYVYYYNSSNNKFSEIAQNIRKTDDGYYEFTITHNSDYILVNEVLDKSLIQNDNGNVVSFQKSNKVYLALIALAFILIIVVSVIVVVASKKNDSEKDKNDKKDKTNPLK